MVLKMVNAVCRQQVAIRYLRFEKLQLVAMYHSFVSVSMNLYLLVVGLKEKLSHMRTVYNVHNLKEKKEKGQSDEEQNK